MGCTHVAQLRISLAFYFGEVSTKALIRCCVRAGILSGFPGPSALALERARRPFSQYSEVLPLALVGGARGARSLSVERAVGASTSAAKMAALHRVATSATAPLVSGRWRVLGAALRRAITSRKAVPADVKEPFSFPFFRNANDYTPFSLPKASGISKFAEWRKYWPEQFPSMRRQDGGVPSQWRRSQSAPRAQL